MTDKVYASGSNGKTIAVLDGTTNSVASLTAPGFLRAIAVNSATNTIYVTETSANGTGPGSVFAFSGD